MKEPQLILKEHNQGAFVIEENEQRLAEMVLAIVDQDLIVYHTEVSPQAEGQGLAKILLNAMVAYAREKSLKVVPLCPFVNAQFKRHPEEFKDIWKTA